MLPFCACFYAEPENGCLLEVSRLLLPPQSEFGLMVGLVGWDKADKSQSSRHIPCAVHLESQQMSRSGRHDGACLLLLSTVSGWIVNKMVCPQAVLIDLATWRRLTI